MGFSISPVDIGLVLIFILFIVHGARSGFVRLLVSFFAAAAAAFAAIYAAKPFGQWVYDRFARQMLYDYLFGKISQAGGEITLASLLPEGLGAALKGFGASPALFTQVIPLTEKTAAQLTKQLIASAAGPALLEFLQMFSVPVLTVLFLAVLDIAAYPLNSLAKKLPVIKTANSVFGGILGALKGLIATAVLSILLSVAAPLSAKQPFLQAVETSKIIETVSHFTGIGG